MLESPPLVAAARVPLADSQDMLRRLCEHFTEHATVTICGPEGRLESPFGRVMLTAEKDALVLRAECPDEAGLYLVKSSLSEHIFELAGGEQPAFVWTGDRAAQTAIPFFQEMTVQRARNITPRMRRVTLAGEDVGRYTSGRGLHVRLLIPPRGRLPVWPTAGADGRVCWPAGADALTARLYTIRSVDPVRSEVDIDVVLHDANHTPGSAWAVAAQRGDRVGLMGPGGGEVPAASRYLLAGDETALPAMARVAESLPAGTQATLLIEVPDPAERQEIASAAALDLRWLSRDGADAGTTSLLPDAIRAFDWAGAGCDLFVMVGCEHAAARTIRAFLRKERGMAKTSHLVAAYWRRGYQAFHANDVD